MNLQPKDQEDRSQIVPSAAFYDAPRGTRDNQRILFCVHIYIYKLLFQYHSSLFQNAWKMQNNLA